jgi:hypothetical protein
MKKFLTCDINGRTYMSYGARHRCSEGRAAQCGSLPVARPGFAARVRRTPCPELLYLQTPGLSLSRAGAATPTSDSGRRCQSLFYRQAFAPLGRETPDVCHFHRLDLERDRQSSLAGGTASWGRSWLTTRQVGNERRSLARWAYRNTRSCGDTCAGRRTGSRAFHGVIRSCLHTGRWACGGVP